MSFQEDSRLKLRITSDPGGLWLGDTDLTEDVRSFQLSYDGGVFWLGLTAKVGRIEIDGVEIDKVIERTAQSDALEAMTAKDWEQLTLSTPMGVDVGSHIRSHLKAIGAID